MMPYPSLLKILGDSFFGSQRLLIKITKACYRLGTTLLMLRKSRAVGERLSFPTRFRRRRHRGPPSAFETF